MYSVEIKFSKGLEKMLDKNTYSKVIQGTLLYIAVEAEGITRREAPVKSRYLRSSITYFANGMVSGVQTKAPYWKYIEYGTEPHIIKPKTKGFLAWEEDKKWHYAKQVKHPGTDPNPFVKRALDRVRRDKIPSTALSRSLDNYVK